MAYFSEKKGGVILSYIGMVVNVIIKFLYTPFLLMALGQSDYGLFSLASSIVGYLAILDLGFGSAVTRYTVKYKSDNDSIKLYKLYSTVSLLYIIIGITALIICLVLASLTTQLFGNTMNTEEVSKLKMMLILCGVNLLFTFPLQISSSVLSAYEKFVFKNLVNLVKYIACPFTMVLLIYLVHIGAVGAIWVVTIFNFMAFFVMYLYSWKRLDFKISIAYIDFNLIKPLFNLSASMFMLMIFEQLQFNSGQFILGMTQGAEVVAVWGIAMVFVLNFRSISTSITNVYMPTFFNLTFLEKWEDIQSYAIRMSRLQSYVLILLLANFIIWGKEFVFLWAGNKYSDAFDAASIIMVPLTLALLFDFSYLIQIAQKRLTYRILTLFIGYIISFIFVCLIFENIDISTYSYIIAASIISSQIFGVMWYVKRQLNFVKIKEILINIVQIASVPISVAIVVLLLLHFTRLSIYSISNFIFYVLFYNIITISLFWFCCFNQSEKNLILRRGK